MRGALSLKLKQAMRAQTLLEYVFVVGIISLALVALGPSIRRGLQAIVKVTADQLRPQNESEQTVDNTSGYLVQSFTSTEANSETTTQESYGVTTYLFNDQSNQFQNSLTNLGFTERNE